jgi:hypothetical protein
MKFSMTGQEKGDLLIQVTTWAGLTVITWTSIEGAVVVVIVWSLDLQLPVQSVPINT